MPPRPEQSPPPGLTAARDAIARHAAAALGLAVPAEGGGEGTFLAAVRALRRSLGQVEDAAVALAVERGATWFVIGEAMGLTPRDAQARYAASARPSSSARVPTSSEAAIR